MEYIIDAELLRKEIEKNKNMIDGLFTEGDDSVYDGEDDAYNRVLRIIDSLRQEQQEVDLEEEVRIYCSSSFRFNYDELNDSFYSNAFEFDDAVELARHFYELGLKARKEEKK